jgi:hypothetical protein
MRERHIDSDASFFAPGVILSVRVHLTPPRIILTTSQLSVAALAVACRGYLNMITLSTHRRAVDKLIDIHNRWKPAEKMLDPAIEVIPQLLVVPVILFVVGLLDSIFSNILNLELLPIPIAAASSMSLFFVAGVVGFLAFALLHASVYPDSSPFQSTLARVVRKIIPTTEKYSELGAAERMLLSTYYEIVQATHEDETLDGAAAALVAMFETQVTEGTYHASRSTDRLLPRAIATLGHLLSPEASVRCNRTATHVIILLKPSFLDPGQPGFYLLNDLAQAARRSAHYRPLVTLWNSAYIQAWAIIAGVFREDHPPVMCLLGSNYTSIYADIVDQQTTGLLFEIFF